MTAALEEIASSSVMSIVYKPFQTEILNVLPELDMMDSGKNGEQNTEKDNSYELGEALEEIPEENVNIYHESVIDEIIIEEKDGVNYIVAFNIDKNMKNLDSNFKDLVDSVLKKKR